MDKTFEKKLENMGIVLTSEMIEQFNMYFELLIEWNSVMNLTTITDEKEVYSKHFFDSICLVKAYDFTNDSLLDVGSGAGFPSIPLKIVFPNLKITIIDSLNKRINFLTEIAKKLNLRNITLIHGRCEDHKFKDSYDIVTARAVSRLNFLSELCVPFVKQGGFFISMKSSRTDEEVDNSKEGLVELGAHIEKVIKYEIEGMSRTLVKIKKDTISDSKYPRMYSKIKKNPLWK